MKLLISDITVCDSQSEFNQKKCDLLIHDSVIEKITLSGRQKATSGVKHINGSGLKISPGWLDLRCALREPGYEYKENIESLAATAAAGGFTGLVTLPSTQPTIQTKADILFVTQQTAHTPVTFYPCGAITHNRDGKEMNELFDMHRAGAVGFTDGNKPLSDSGVLLRALQYARIFGGRLFVHCLDEMIASGGKMHEGKMSVTLGLKGIPAIAEEVMIQRDIALAGYAESALHFSHLSSKGAVDLIKQARKKNPQITCDVSVANLAYTDEMLHEFNSNYKVTPPLRSEEDRKALWKGIEDGTIDCIVSDHHPEDTERKQVEFDYAAQGMIQLQTVLPVLLRSKPADVSAQKMFDALTHRPRRILGLPKLCIEQGAVAELTLFDEKETWTYSDDNNISKSKNSPELGNTLRGKVKGIIHRNQFYKTS